MNDLKLSGWLLRVVPALLVLSVSVNAQWLNFPTPGTPRTKDGKPNLTAPPPRTTEGKPDLSGVWMHEITTVEEMRRLYGAAMIDEAVKVNVPGMEIGTQHKYAFNLFLDFKPAEAPLRPETVEFLRRLAADPQAERPCSEVFGFPLAGLLSEPIKIVQSPRLTVVMYEVDNLHRQIFTDGRALPKEYDKPAYLGYSIGRWQGDVLVVETAGFNDQTRLDVFGHPHGEKLRITERFRRRDFGHLDVEMTFDDPEYYTKPFTVKIPHDLLADADIFEMFCNENEKDRTHMQKR